MSLSIITAQPRLHIPQLITFHITLHTYYSSQNSTLSLFFENLKLRGVQHCHHITHYTLHLTHHTWYLFSRLYCNVKKHIMFFDFFKSGVVWGFDLGNQICLLKWDNYFAAKYKHQPLNENFWQKKTNYLQCFCSWSRSVISIFKRHLKEKYLFYAS